MATEPQIAANRANATKSTGPTSSAGRQKSSRNSLRHGMLADAVVLSGESTSRFKSLITSLELQFKPSNPVEFALIENMAVARWRQMRLWCLEKFGIEHEIRQRDSVGHNHNNHDRFYDKHATRASLAFRALSDTSHSLDLMNRYETCQNRQFDRALSRLTKLRAQSNISERTQFCLDTELPQPKPDENLSSSPTTT